MNTWIIYGIIALVIILIISWYLFKKFLHLAIIFLMFILALFIYNNYLAPQQVCGIENCHGLDIQCGPEPAEICTEIYQLGDKCRTLASCEIIKDQCQPYFSEEFNACKACVNNCILIHINEIDKQFECESLC
ncbi:hypothetical protein J4468_00700 [Candidatus Woesearchaeota archaeon]|nr:hypothetical protein [Candidatus Woesearchaeota archaeon]